MSNTTFKLKRSAVKGKSPTTGQLQLGELAVNTIDGNLYFKTVDSSAVENIVTLREITENNLAINSSGLTKSESTTLAGVLDDLDSAITNGITADDVLSPTGVVSGTYGTSSQVGTFTVDSAGRITSAINTPISLSTFSTSDLSEGSNLYYTTARFDTRFDTKTTDDLTEGVTNKYYSSSLATTDARNAISVSDTGGDGSLTYNSTTGVITYTGPSAAEVRAHFSAGTAITLTDGVIAHADTSTQASVDNSNGTVIQDITLDTFGHITAITSLDLDSRYYTETEADSRFVNAAGDTMTGFLTLNADPTQALHAATKEYVDNTAAGLFVKTSAKTITTSALPSVTYDNGTNGVGSTLTATANGAIGTINGYTLTQGDYILVKDQASALENGEYVVTQVGDASNPFILTRSTDDDESDEIAGSYIFIEDGNDANTGWVLTVQDTATFTIGTDSILVSQFSGAGTYSAGFGLNLVGTQFNVDSSLDVSVTSAATSGTATTLDGLTSTIAELNKLDGFTGSFQDLNYAVSLNATGVTSTEYSYLDGVTSSIQTQINTKLDASSYTAADVLEKIKTVDSNNSGLNADTLDGQQGSHYRINVYNSAGTLLN